VALVAAVLSSHAEFNTIWYEVHAEASSVDGTAAFLLMFNDFYSLYIQT
jgi:hypothetical protein